MQILLVEDDAVLARHIEAGLTQEGHVVVHCPDGRSGLMQVTCETYDVVILDRMLPGVEGMKILSAMRASGNETPVLMLSALGEVDDRVEGLRAGSDDYLAKPFAFSELLARVEAASRRSVQSAQPPAGKLRIADLVIDLEGHVVRRAGTRLDLTMREFRILVCLARNAGRVVTRAMLLEQVWDYNFDPQTNIIDQHISNLRQKLKIADQSPLIHTVRGAGYVLRP